MLPPATPPSSRGFGQEPAAQPAIPKAAVLGARVQADLGASTDGRRLRGVPGHRRDAVELGDRQLVVDLGSRADGADPHFVAAGRKCALLPRCAEEWAAGAMPLAVRAVHGECDVLRRDDEEAQEHELRVELQRLVRAVAHVAAAPGGRAAQRAHAAGLARQPQGVGREPGRDVLRVVALRARRASILHGGRSLRRALRVLRASDAGDERGDEKDEPGGTAPHARLGAAIRSSTGRAPIVYAASRSAPARSRRGAAIGSFDSRLDRAGETGELRSPAPGSSTDSKRAP